jgi:hypothetical protein
MAEHTILRALVRAVDGARDIEIPVVLVVGGISIVGAVHSTAD